jgi:hypothetical protein
MMTKYDELLLIATKALDQAASISKMIQGLLLASRTGGSFEAFQHDHEVLEAEALERSRDEMRDWWLRRKAAFQPIIVSKGNLASLPRSDIFPDGPQRTEATPKRRFIVSDGSLRRKKKKDGYGSRGPVGFSTNGIDAPVSADATARAPQPRRYRKFCDELLLRHLDESAESVRSVPNPCPSTAPEMPPDIIAILQQRRISSSTV